MGYDLHITRAEDWCDSESQPITLEEWLTCVEADPEMRLDKAAEVTTPDGHALRYESEGLAVWTVYSRNGIDGNFAWFDHRRGEIVVKNPDQEIRRKMAQLATKLDARVQGDDGELYDLTGHPQSEGQMPRAHNSWWTRLRRLIGLS